MSGDPLDPLSCQKPERVTKLEEALELNRDGREMHMTLNEMGIKFQEDMVDWTWKKYSEDSKESSRVTDKRVMLFERKLNTLGPKFTRAAVSPWCPQEHAIQSLCMWVVTLRAGRGNKNNLRLSGTYGTVGRRETLSCRRSCLWRGWTCWEM